MDKMPVKFEFERNRSMGWLSGGAQKAKFAYFNLNSAFGMLFLLCKGNTWVAVYPRHKFGML